MDNPNAVNMDAGIVKEQSAQQMQQISTAEVTNAAKAAPAIMPAQLGIVMLLTFDNVTPLKASPQQLHSLKGVTFGQGETAVQYDLHNPVGSKSAERGTPAGILRAYFQTMYRLISELSGSTPLFLGKPEERSNYVADVAVALINTLQDTFPAAPNAEIVAKDEFDVDSIRLNDILRVQSWTDSMVDSGIEHHTIFLNLVINSAKLQESSDKFKANVTRTYQRLQSLIEKADVATPISAWLIFREDAQSLLSDENRSGDWLDLQEEFSFDVLTRSQYRRIEREDPANVSWIKPDSVFGKEADVVYFVSLTPELDAADEELEDSVEEEGDDAEE